MTLILHRLNSLYPHSRGAAHAVEVAPGARWLFTNGQVGTNADGTIPDGTVQGGMRAQADVCFKRLGAILHEARMGPEDLVRLDVFMVGNGPDHDLTQEMLDAKDAFLGGHIPGCTFFWVNALSRPGLLVEVEAVAAKVD